MSRCTNCGLESSMMFNGSERLKRGCVMISTRIFTESLEILWRTAKKEESKEEEKHYNISQLYF